MANYVAHLQHSWSCPQCFSKPYKWWHGRLESICLLYFFYMSIHLYILQKLYGRVCASGKNIRNPTSEYLCDVVLIIMWLPGLYAYIFDLICQNCTLGQCWMHALVFHHSSTNSSAPLFILTTFNIRSYTTKHTTSFPLSLYFMVRNSTSKIKRNV